jgi:hypothetical protein
VGYLASEAQAPGLAVLKDGIGSQSVKLGKIKQTFERLAKRIVEIEEGRSSEESQLEQRPLSLPTIRGGAVVQPELVEAGAQALDEITELTESGGLWSRSKAEIAGARSTLDGAIVFREVREIKSGSKSVNLDGEYRAIVVGPRMSGFWISGGLAPKPFEFICATERGTKAKTRLGDE